MRMTPTKGQAHSISLYVLSCVCETVGVGVGGRAYMWLINAPSFQLLITFLKEVLICFDISPIEVKYTAVMFSLCGSYLFLF